MSLLDRVVVRPSGETAVVLEVGDSLDAGLHAHVLALDEAIRGAPPAGVVDVVPTYRSVLLRLDHRVTTPDQVLATLAGRPDVPTTDRDGAVHEVVVSVDAEDAEDLDAVGAALDLAPDEVVRALVEAHLVVAFHGFVPGFAYLAGVPPSLALPRRATPRAPVRPGAVLLAAGQAALCPTAMPTGWWVVGRTDHVLFDPDASPPVPFAPGDRVRLVAT